MSVNVPYTKYDSFRWALNITSSNQTIRLDTDGDGKIAVDIPTGYYWHHKDADVDPDYPSFAIALEDSLNSTSTHSYSVDYVEPSNGSWGSSNTVGLLIQTTGTNNFTIEFSHSDFGFPPEILGYDPDRSSDTSNSGSHTSPFSVYGMWVPSKASKDHRPQYRSIHAASDSGDTPYSVQWDTPTSRRNLYYKVASPFILKDRADLQGEVDGTPLAKGDKNNALEDMWLDSVAPDGLGKGKIIVSYNDDAGVDTFFDAEWDVIRWEDGSQKQNFFNAAVLLDDKDYAGEFYTVDFDSRVILDGDTVDDLSGYLIGDYMAKLLTHWFGESSNFAIDDFRNASASSTTWTTPYGGLSVTAGSTPSLISPLGDHDGDAIDLDSNSLTVGDDAILDPESDDHSQFVFMTPLTITSGQKDAWIHDSSTSSEVELQYDDNNPPRWKMSAVDESGNATGNNASDGLAEDKESFGLQTLNQSQDQHAAYGIYKGRGSVTGGASGLGIGTVTPNNDLDIGGGPIEFQMYGAVDGPCEDNMVALAWNAIQDKEKRVNLPITGDASSGFSRELPSRVEQNAVYWWNAKRAFRYTHNDNISVLSDHSGGRYMTSAGADRPTAMQFNSERGTPLYAVDFDGSQVLTADHTMIDMSKGATVFFVAGKANDSSQYSMFSGRENGGSAFFDIEWKTQDEVQFSVRDTSGSVTISAAHTVEGVSKGMAMAFRFDKGNDEVRVWVHDGFNITDSNTTNSNLGTMAPLDELYLGGTWGGAGEFVGTVREMQVVDEVMSAGNIEDKLESLNDVHEDYIL